MKVKDHFYSKEEFELIEGESGVKKTSPIPSNIEEYYDSENYISHVNEKKSLTEKAYSFIQKLNFNYKYKILKHYSKNGKILDYGCGNGAFLRYLRDKSNYQLFGYEPNMDVEIEGVTIYQSQDQITDKYDIIMLWHVFEHVENREETLNLLRNHLSENGVLIIALPNYTSFDAKFYKNNWAAWDVPRHIYHYSKKGAINYFTKKEHFYLDKIYPMPFDSYYISIMSAQYSDSLIQKIISPAIGAFSNIQAIATNQWSSLVYVLKNKM